MDHVKHTNGILSKYLESTEETWLDTPAVNNVGNYYFKFQTLCNKLA